MKKILILTAALCVAPFIDAMAVSYLQYGAVCTPQDTDVICAPPLICYASTDYMHGVCIASCDTTLDDPFGFGEQTWTSNGSNSAYQSRRCAPCLYEADCRMTTQYRCNYNYYGASANGTSGCTACPDGGSSNAGTTDITGCYLPSGTSATDNSGTYTTTGKCYYTK